GHHPRARDPEEGPSLVGRVLHAHRARGRDPLDVPAPRRGRRDRARQAHPHHRLQRLPLGDAPLRRSRVPDPGGRRPRELPAHPPRRAERHHPGRLPRRLRHRLIDLLHPPALPDVRQDDHERRHRRGPLRGRLPRPPGDGGRRRGRLADGQVRVRRI
ncbi:MAG: dCMP deaminase @ Late competence protein ComEB, partial [uncultured Rubrobacteraceae bacterium]